MQKKIIALAIAGLASTAAFAQSNVTIYGSVDYGYSYRFDAENRTTGQHTRSGIDSGQQAGNRLGFKGVEDLGNGLKAVFLLEQGFNMDNGTWGQGGLAFGRQAYVGLAGGFGTAVGGRLYTPHWGLTSAIDPFAGGTVGQYRNVWGAQNTNGSILNLLDPVRVDNAVAYISPNFGGLDVTLAYSNAAGPDGTITPAAAATSALFSGPKSQSGVADNAGENAKNSTVYAALVKYNAGPVLVGLNLHRIAASTTVTNASGFKTVDSATLGMTFDAKVVKVHAMTTYSKIDANYAQGDVTMANYLVGVTAPFGKNMVKASVAFSDLSSGSATGLGGNATQYAVGYDYNFSKRTNLYTAYSLIDQSQLRSAIGLGTGDASNSGSAGAPAGLVAIGGNNAFQQAFQVGVRHQF